MKNILKNDMVRCTTNRCDLNSRCARYLQNGIDYMNKDKTPYVRIRLGGDVPWVKSCVDFIPMENEKALEALQEIKKNH